MNPFATTRPNPARHWLPRAFALFSLLGLSLSAPADVTNRFSATFTNDVPPAGTTLFGSAVVTNDFFLGNQYGEFLALTGTRQFFELPAEELGSFIVEDLSAGQMVNAFDVQWRKASPAVPGASSFDEVGYSFSWGTSLTNEPFGELGSGTNLVVSFVRFDGGVAGAMDVYWNGTRIRRENVADTRGVFDSANYGPARVTLTEEGLLTVSHGDGGFTPRVFSVTLPGYAGLAGARFGWGARSIRNTGRRHQVDDLQILTTRLSGEVAGRVTRAGRGEPGVTLSLASNGVPVASFTTASDGSFSFAGMDGLETSTYTLQPAKPGLTFVPEQRTFTGRDTNVSFQVIVYAGQVVLNFPNNGTPMPGITVSVTNVSTQAGFVTTSDAAGRFEIVGMPAGQYQTRPARGALSFTDRYSNPAPRWINLGSDSDDSTNALWRVTSQFIAGYVRGGGIGLPGVTVSGAGSDVTDANGFYVLTGPFEEPYLISPSQAGLEFTPPTFNYQYVSRPTFVDFEAAAAVAGRVLNLPASLAGQSVIARLPAPDNRAFTNFLRADGTFTLTNLPLLATGLTLRVAMPTNLPSGSILPASFRARPGQTDLEATYFGAEPITVLRLGYQPFPRMPLEVTVTPEPIRSVFEVDTAPPPPDQWPYQTNRWLADKQPAAANLGGVDFANQAAFAAVYPPAASGPFGLEVTNWPVQLQHGPDALYTFYLTSDDGAALYLDGDLLVANERPPGPVIRYDFNSGLPPSTALYGSAYVSDGVLELNPFQAGQVGAFRSEIIAPGQALAGFTARFRARVNYAGGPGPADGFSFNWATDLPEGAYGETGAGSGLRVTFDTFFNGPGDTYGVSAYWNGALLATVPVAFLATDTDTFAEVLIRLAPAGTLDVSYKGQTLFAGLPLPGYQPLTDARFGLGARTGGSYETHGMDDFDLQFIPVDQPAGAVTRSATLALPGGGTHAHQLALRYFDRGGEAALKVEYALNENVAVGPEPGFSVQHIYLQPGDTYGWCNVPGALAALGNLPIHADYRRDRPATLNYSYGTTGRFPGDWSFGPLPSGVSAWVTEATATVHIPTAGEWTFGVRSDDGFACWVGNQYFDYSGPRSPADTLATFTLAAGDYPVRLIMFNCVTDSELEFFAAPGAHGTFNSAFRLVGDTFSGGLAASYAPTVVARDVVPGPAAATFAKLPVTYTNAFLLDAENVVCAAERSVEFTPRHVGPLSVTVQSPTARFEPPTAVVANNSAATLTASGGFSGRVTDAAGAPLAGIAVRVVSTVSLFTPCTPPSPGDYAILLTDADGRFTLAATNLFPGLVNFMPERPGTAFVPPFARATAPRSGLDFMATGSGPQISALANQVMDEDTELVLPFSVNDFETPADLITVSAQANNPALFPPGSLVLGGSGSQRTLTLRPAFNASSPNPVRVTLTANDRVSGGSAAFAVRTLPMNFTFSASYVDQQFRYPGPDSPIGQYLFVPVINFNNSGFTSHFSGATEFPGLSGPADNFIVEIISTVTIPTSGDWTFGVRSDDGFLCTLGTNTFSFDGLRGADDTLATFNLAAGTYPLRLVFFEQYGGAGLEFFAAPGTHASFNSSFRLVGDTDNGGLEAGGSDTTTTFDVLVNPVNDPPTAGAYTGVSLTDTSLYAAGGGGLISGDQLTIEFWQKLPGPTPHETVAVYPNDGNRFLRTYVPYVDGRVYFDFGDWTTAQGRLSYTPPAEAALYGEWVHWAFVADRTANGGLGLMQIYRNGELEAEKQSAQGLNPNAAAFFIGGNSYRGSLAEVRVWTTARTAQQIVASKDVPLRGNEPGLTLYYRFLEGSGPAVRNSARLDGQPAATMNPATPATWLADGQGYVHALPVDEDTPREFFLPAFDFESYEQPLPNFDNTVLTYALVTAPTNGVLTQLSGGRWRYFGNTNYSGPDSFVYSVTDSGGQSATARIFLAVSNVNDVPTISTIPNQVITENRTSAPIPFTVDDGDGFPELLEVTALSSDPVLVRVENIVFQGTGSSRSLTITPEPGQSGTLTITLIVSDGLDQASTQFDVRIEPEPAYSVVEVGAPAGRPLTFGTAINSRGAVAAFGAINSLGQQSRAFVNQGLDNGLAVTELGTLGGPTAAAYGINALNEVVGVSLTSANQSRAFKYDGVTLLDLGTLTGGAFSQATAINDAGVVVGFATVSGVKHRAFRYREGQGMQDLGTLPGFDDASQAHAISDDGDVAGVSFAANGHGRAFLWRVETATMTDLGTLGGTNSTARGVNRFGHVVGTASLPDGATRAFLWRDGQLTSLGTLPEGANSDARAINEFGQVVGSAINSNGVRRATLFTQGQMYDLNELIPEEQQLAGWVLTEANAINRRGEIVGTGTRNGQTRAFLVVPAAVIGRQVVRPQGTVARRPEIDLLEFQPGDTAENSFFFSDAAGEKKLYATRPVTARIKWPVTANQLDTNRVAAVSINVWPKFPQIHVATAPVEVEPALPNFAHKYIETRYRTPGSDALVDPNTKIFNATNPAYTVLMYLRNEGSAPNPQTQPPYFEVARTLAVHDAKHYLADQPAVIGPALTSPFHRDHPGRSGFTYFPRCFIDASGEEGAYDRAARVGPILPVNRRTPARFAYADPLVVVWYATNSINVSWAHKAIGYQPDWATNAPTIVIASGEGAGYLPPNLFQDVRLYNQPRTNLPGFNPDEEHALLLPGPSGDTVFALRNDLNAFTDFSDPYALLKYRDPQANFEWRILAHRVVITNATHRFLYTGDVGKEIQPPFPLSVFSLCSSSEVISGPGWQDKNGRLYARAAGAGLNDPVEIVARYQYPMQPGFYYDLNRDGTNDAAIGVCVPWLDRRPGGTAGQSIDVTYAIFWPTNAPTLQIGQTLLRATQGLPDLANFASAEIIFDSTNPFGTNLAGADTRLFDPLEPRILPLNSLANLSVPAASYQFPPEIKRTRQSGVETFDDVPPDLADRLKYDPINRWLRFEGTLDETGVGQPLLLLNVMTPRERDRLLELDGTNGVSDWDKIITALYHLTRNPRRVDLDPRDGQPDQALRLGLANQYTVVSNGVTRRTFVRPTPTATVQILATNVVAEPLSGTKALIATGYRAFSGPRFITLAENNADAAEGPVALHVIRVEGGPFAGELKFLTPANLFSEKLSIRHSADFGAEPERLQFEWYYKPDSATFDPTDLPRVGADGEITDPRGWLFYSGATPADGTGVNSLTLGEGGESSLLTLGDNWFVGRYRGLNVGGETNWTGWIGDPSGGSTPRAALAEGWIKRVVRGVNPFDQRFRDFHNNEVDTFASMLIQAGTRYEGDIALNQDSLGSVGLIAAYSTLLNRGKRLSIEGIPAVNFDPANNALLFAASRIADLYTLLGNEAFADAADPTIGFGIGSGEYGSAATRIHAFQNQTASLLEEELALLRGRDNTSAGVGGAPVYNRLFWNFTLGEGELAYQQSFNIGDFNLDGFIDERDARIQFPQGHGDAWGHYLTAGKLYYDLMRHPYFTWVPRAESLNILGTAVAVDYFDERKFATIAAAKAKAGAEIVGLTYRQKYVDDTAGQWQGYQDTNPDRAWGVTEWARRAGQAALFDWVAGNALLFATDPDPTHTGVQKIDRQTVLELGEMPTQLSEIQKQLDQADIGLNPVGLAKGAVPFDIDPAFLEIGSTMQGKGHFEQIADRAIQALNNAVAVFDEANKFSSLLRRNQDDVDRFVPGIADEEMNYKNRLIEIFGYPYAGDIGAGKTYPAGYNGPDTYHWMYVTTRAITGENTPPNSAFVGYFKPTPNGLNVFTHFPGSQMSFSTNFNTTTLETSILEVNYPVTDSAASYSFVAPAAWGSRRAPGKIQEALSEVVQQEARLKQALQNYDGLINLIGDQLELLAAQKQVDASSIKVLNNQRQTLMGMNAAIGTLKGIQVGLRRASAIITGIAETIRDALPLSVGLATDVTSGARSAIRGTALGAVIGLESTADALEIAENSIDLAKEDVGLRTEIQLEVLSRDFEVLQRVKEIQNMMRDEAASRIEVALQREILNQAVGRYRAAVAEGERLLDELAVFRQRTAAEVAEQRYEDMTFRLFRNQALQKYRASFDLAARYVYIAANAYDYELNFLGADTRAGREFLTDIIRQRTLGQVVNGLPVAGQGGLADPLARMLANWTVLRTRFGVNNPLVADSRFSLRRELFRIRDGDGSDALWTQSLTQSRVRNLWDLPEFRRYCRPFAPESAGPQPGLVIRFPTTITFALNFFGWPLSGGDSTYDPTRFSTKINRAGVWFTGSDGSQISQTPNIYLVPAGMDVLRSPSADSLATREWRVVDQVVPEPFPIGQSALSNPNWIPFFDSVGGSFTEIRRFSSFPAYHDQGIYVENQTTPDTRLVGRSVWNTDWLLIIPGGTLLNDPNAGIDTFINTVEDIKIYFQTYSYSGN